ncbi:transglutaminaseTgpA domain-containing protein [Pseudomonadota bacterium]
MQLVTPRLMMAERLTLAVLITGVVSLALSDFVSPFYWSAVMLISMFRLIRGPVFALSEMQASFVGWAGFIWVGIELALGRAWVIAFTDFLLILAMAVVIEAPTPRNHLHRMLVGMFLVLGAAVLTDSVLYILPLALFVWVVWRASQCLYGMNVSGGELPMPGWRREIRLMPWIGLLVLAIFIMLPRFDFQTYLKPTQPKKVTSGFGSEVRLGEFARELDPTVMMRVEPVSMDINAFQRLMVGRYWRGTALSIYNGRGWQRHSAEDIRYWQRGMRANFSDHRGEEIALYREASDHPYIMLPEGALGVVRTAETMKMDEAGALRFVHAPARRIRMLMEVEARRKLLPDMAPPTAAELDISRVPDVVARWARATASGASSPRQRVVMLVNEMQGWSYDLNAPIDAARPVESFLNSRRGHCELYATLLALSLRSQEIPARVVNGYFGGEWNEVGGFYLIRQQHAHSWVEAWVDGSWQRYDSTPSSRWQLTGVYFSVMDEVWESVKLTWYRYVLEFQDSDRGELFQKVTQLLKRYLLPVVAVLLLFAVAWLFLRQSLQHGFFQRREWPVLDRWLDRHGVKRLLHQPLRFVPIPEGVDVVAWNAFVVAWEQQTYGAGSSWSRWEVRRHLRALSQNRC